MAVVCRPNETYAISEIFSHVVGDVPIKTDRRIVYEFQMIEFIPPLEQIILAKCLIHMRWTGIPTVLPLQSPDKRADWLILEPSTLKISIEQDLTFRQDYTWSI